MSAPVLRLPASHETNVVRLTHREIEVIKLLALGKLNKMIAGALDISSKTVEKHRANIYEKLDLMNQPESQIVALVHWAIRHGFIQVQPFGRNLES